MSQIKKKEDRDLKLQIIKAVKAIRKKHMQLKVGEADVEKLLQKTFKPIVDPLNELNKQKMEPIKQPESKQEIKSIKQENIKEEEEQNKKLNLSSRKI
ncbi:hypothetical protein QE152_g1122 [Popillia japonica]|uniref:Uncharacterized protein n=1 Tax=Popillia japonica TaxID=7064 RepID=A0AAW1N3M4_POPJA